jgi:peptidoglycan/xylan/chitin deacetylase (PgdA/CDA1 family)/predicted MFS family arabinose efflux permease
MSTLTVRSPLSNMLARLRPLGERRTRKYALLTFTVDAGLVFTLLVAVQSYLPEQYQASEAIAGYVLAAYGAAKLIGQLPAGHLIDRLGPKRGLFGGLCLAVVGQAAMLLAAAQPLLGVAGAALYGLGAAAIWPSVFSMAAAEFAEDERARLSAGMTVATGAAVATALGLGLILPPAFPYLAAITISVCALLSALLFVGWFPNAPPIKPEAQTGGSRPLAWLRLLKSPRRSAFSLIFLLQGATLGALIAVFGSYGRTSLHVSVREELVLFAPAAAAAACAVLLSGSLADRVGRIPVLGAGFLAVTVGVWGLSASTDTGAVVLLATLTAVGLALAMPSASAMAMDLAQSGETATLLGWFLTMESIGHAVGPALGGALNQAGGPAPALWLAGGLAAVAAVIAIVPPVWSKTPQVGIGRRPLRTILAFSAKGGLVFSLGFPVIAVYLAWQPGSQLYGQMLTHGPRDRMEVAITFDDGPNDPWTLRIADTLDRYGVEGTFFTVGKNAESHPEIVRSLVAQGHLIGNHSYRHHKSDAVVDPGYAELWKAERAISSAAGVCPAIYRPPNGFHTPWQLHAVASHSMKTVTWDVIPRDWKDPPPDEVARRVLDSVKPGSIILLHDGKDTDEHTDRSATLNALPGIIEGLRAKGYQIVRLDRLLSVPGYLESCGQSK